MSYSTLIDALHRALIVDPPEPPHDPPRRIQLRRTKGWRKPEGAIVVARPSKWGNPWRIATGCQSMAKLDAAIVVAMFERDLTECLQRPFAEPHDIEIRIIAESIAELRGHDLACWCPLDAPCHADVLLRLANPAPLTECRDCWGTDPRCPVCHGAGWWRG